MKNKFSTYDLVVVAMFAAILAVISQISIPLPNGVPITLQTFAIAFMGVVLGTKKGIISYTIWFLLGLVGVPVFSQWHSGLNTIVGPTGGFIFGFFFLTLFSGVILSKNRLIRIGIVLMGLVVTHLLGIIQFSILMHYTVSKTFYLVSLPFLIKDIISVILALYVGDILRKRLFKANAIIYS